MGLFTKKPLLEVNFSKQTIKVNEVLELSDLYKLIAEYFHAKGSALPLTKVLEKNSYKLMLVNGWKFHSSTISLYRQKDDRRYKHVRTSGKDNLKSEWKIR